MGGAHARDVDDIHGEAVDLEEEGEYGQFGWDIQEEFEFVDEVSCLNVLSFL